MTKNKKNSIAKNTLMLYIRQLLTLFVSLFTVRVVLNVLGSEDYGIYTVIGGIVLFFSFLKGTMASATQRFFSFEIGRKDRIKLRQTFTVNLIVYISIALIAFLLLETLGMWYVTEKLKIPADRADSALFLFRFSIFTFVISVFNTPFMAIIIAHEDMKHYAYISIAEVLLKLGIVILLIYYPWDKLELYGVLLFLVSIVVSTIYFVVCLKKYDECQFKKFYWNKKLFFELLNFTSWTLFGQISTVFRKQGILILINQTFNPVVVAAMAIATNISSQVSLFSVNFNVSLYPPIIKNYAAGKQNEMFTLIHRGSKFTFFLLWVFALPLYIEMETILVLWLKNVPEGTIFFTRLALIEVLIISISYPLTTAARAPGKMKAYELILGTIQFLIFFVSWLFLDYGYEAYYSLIIAIAANILMFFIRLFILRKLINLNVKNYLSSVFVPISGIIACSLIPTLITSYYLQNGGIFYSLILIALSVIFSTISMYFIGVNLEMRIKINKLIKDKLSIIYKLN